MQTECESLNNELPGANPIMRSPAEMIISRNNWFLADDGWAGVFVSKSMETTHLIPSNLIFIKHIAKIFED
jgi:hypothetical protein